MFLVFLFSFFFLHVISNLLDSFGEGDFVLHGSLWQSVTHLTENSDTCVPVAYKSWPTYFVVVFFSLALHLITWTNSLSAEDDSLGFRNHYCWYFVLTSNWLHWWSWDFKLLWDGPQDIPDLCKSIMRFLISVLISLDLTTVMFAAQSNASSQTNHIYTSNRELNQLGL